MKLLPVRALLGGLIGLALLGGQALAAPTHSHAYTVKEVTGKSASGYVFAPASLTIHVGDKVTFVDASTPMVHDVVGLDAFSTSVIDKTALDSKSYSVVFKKKGTYKYHCTIHPGMQGTIVVK